MTIHRNLKGQPLCPIHWQELTYSHEFEYAGKTFAVWVCPLSGHVEFIPNDDNDLNAAELVAA